MQMQTEKRSTKIKTWAASIASGLLLAMLAAYIVTPEDLTPEPAAPAAQADAPVRFGPGVWTEPAPDATASVEPVVADTHAPGGLAVTADNYLVINKALRDVADYFLLGGHPGTRSMHADKLFAHLKASLPSPAFEEAEQIMRTYITYLDSHDQLLARESMPAATPDSMHISANIERIATWIAQRSRLRQNLLGLQVTKVWFEDEEAQDQQLITTMRQRGSGTTPPAPLSPEQQDGLQDLREKNASYAEQREYILSHFGEQAAQRFDAIEGKERAWKTRYASYRQNVENILRQAEIDAAERSRLIEALRAQTFDTEPERRRAQNLDALPPPEL